MTIEIPDNWLGKKLDGSLERILQKPATQIVVPPSVPTIIIPANNLGINKADYINLPSAKHSNYEYGETLVAMERTHLNSDWHAARDGLAVDGAYMLTIRQFADFLNLLRSGQASDGNGNRIQPSRLTDLYNDITEVRNPWRSEWLDARFVEQQTGTRVKVPGTNIGIPGTARKEMHITYHAVNSQGVFQEVTEILEPYLACNKTPGINLDNWLSGATKHGIPPPNTPDGDLWYWRPTDGKVARFVAGSGGADLSCGRDPSYRGSSLGVRAARAKI